MTEQNRIAGTIMLTNDDGETFFLVSLVDTELAFPRTFVKEEKSPLASILENLLEHVELDSEKVRLLDLTNIRTVSGKTPFFVFDVTIHPSDITLMLKNPDIVCWKPAKEVRNLLQGLQLGGVPIYK